MAVDVIAIGELKDPLGNVLDHGDTLKVGVKLDQGWTWSATVLNMPGYNVRHARSAEYTITLKDGFGNTLVLPPMVALPRTLADVNNINNAGRLELSGVDATTRKMGIKQQNFRSFRATSSSAIVSALSARGGITVTGMLNWYVHEEEVKGEPLAEALDRLREIVAYDAVINLAGEVECSAWEASGPDLDFVWSNRKHVYDDSQIFTAMRIGKRSSRNRANDQTYEFDHAGSEERALSGPMNGVSAYEAGDLGVIQAVGFFNGPTASPGTGLVHFLSWDTTISAPPIATGPPPATHMVVTLRNIGMPYPRNAILKVTGTPYDEESWPPGLDLAFLYPHPNNDPEDPDSPDTSLGDWPCDEELIDPLFLGESWAVARYPYILAKKNSAGDKQVGDGVWQLGVFLQQRATYGSHVYKVSSVDWDLSSKKTSVEMLALAA